MMSDTKFTVYGNTGTIETVDDWYNHAKPKQGQRHWKPGRSAMELARAWCVPDGPHLPSELHRLLETAPQTRGFAPTEAYAEKVTRLDTLRGEGRNHDLVIVGSAKGVCTLLTIEAKADESFGDTIAVRLSRAKAGSQIKRRISAMASAILNRKLDHDVTLLRYQLLHALAGTLIEAQLQGARQAVFTVHEFRSSKCKPRNVKRNADDWEEFVRILMPNAVPTPSGILGPIRVHGSDTIPSDISLFLGKVLTEVDGI